MIIERTQAAALPYDAGIFLFPAT